MDRLTEVLAKELELDWKPKPLQILYGAHLPLAELRLVTTWNSEGQTFTFKECACMPVLEEQLEQDGGSQRAMRSKLTGARGNYHKYSQQLCDRRSPMSFRLTANAQVCQSVPEGTAGTWHLPRGHTEEISRWEFKTLRRWRTSRNTNLRRDGLPT